MFRIDLGEYNYSLPDERIAQFPLKERDGSKLIVYRNGSLSESLFINLHEFLPSGTLLVFNNTKVIRARLLFKKESGAIIEIFLLEPMAPGEYDQVFSIRGEVEWRCLVGNLRRWKEPVISSSFGEGRKRFDLAAEKINRDGDSWRIRFRWNNAELNFGEVVESSGHIPLPPYIKRADRKEDAGRYQTIYSMINGSVAAPTAGLHFTRRIFDSLEQKGINKAELTLHVGAGTFQPLKSDNIYDHEMHTEHFIVETALVENLLKNQGRIVAVGTTSVRTLESLYWLGIKLLEKPETKPDELYLGQWEVYSMKQDMSANQSLESVLYWMESNRLSQLKVPTRIIIVPGYSFKIVEGVITNFHLPKSTLLLLVSAFTGRNWKRIYDYALEHNFRFLSYGDSSLLLK